MIEPGFGEAFSHVLGDHYGGKMRRRTRQIGHNRCINYAQSGNPDHSALRVHDRSRVLARTHPTGAPRMQMRVAMVDEPIRQCCIISQYFIRWLDDLF